MLKHFKKLLLLVLLFTVLSFGGWAVYHSGQALKSYQLKGELTQLSREQIDPIVQPYLTQSFWQVDMVGLQTQLNQLEWVESALVKRQWPDKLLVRLIEQKPIVRWGENALLNYKGQIFYPADLQKEVPNFEQFVVLTGNDIQAENLLTQFVKLQAAFDSAGWQIAQLDAMVDGVWRLNFTSGWVVVLNPQDWQAKVESFLKALPKVSENLRKFAQTFDLRYSNGFVIEKTIPTVILPAEAPPNEQTINVSAPTVETVEPVENKVD